jgi:hypothetical protein
VIEVQARVPILAQTRSGSTMLCCALSNHPEIHCTRGEPLHRLNSFRWAFGGEKSPWGNEVWRQILGLVFNQWGYRACAAKVNWGPGTEVVWDWLARMRPAVKAIRLTRENRLRQAASDIIRRATRWTESPRVHTAKPLPSRSFRIEPGILLQLMKRLDADEAKGKDMLSQRGIATLAITYEEMVIEERLEITHLNGNVSARLCDWLAVENQRLPVRPARRVNREPLRELLSNWPEVEAAVATSPWAACLEKEAKWS